MEVYVTRFTEQRECHGGPNNIWYSVSRYTLLFSLPHDAFTAKVTKAFPDPSGCLLDAFGSIQRHHEYYIEAQEEREEKESEGAGKRRMKEVYADKCW